MDTKVKTDIENLRINGDRLWASLMELAQIGATPKGGVCRLTLTDLDSRATARDQHYGLVRLNGEPKPVFHALKRFLSICGPRLEPDTPPAVQGASPEGLISIGWKRPDGTRLWMVWAEKAGEVRIVTPAGAQATLHQPVSGQQQRLKAAEGRWRVPVSTALQILVMA